MSTQVELKGGGRSGGFQRWVKLPTDDLPLIRPPKHHMLAHITGGLTKLYELIKENKPDEPEESEEDKLKNSEEKATENNGPTDNGLCDKDTANKDNSDTAQSGESENKDTTNKDDSESTEQKNTENDEDKEKNKKKDDEGGGDKAKSEKSEKEQEPEEMMDEEEETTPYTDEEGEFVPEKPMPYLAGRYKYTNILARGQSAIIIKVLDTFNNDRPLAIKVLHRVYKPIGSQEADILLELHRADPWLHVPFARLLNQFLYGPHYCLVFDYLSPTPLYNHYDQRDIRETSALPHIRDLTIKLLTVLGFLYKQNVIHADLKPENILLSKEDNLASIMVVDFGNALRNTDEELSLYYSDFELQTLLYRAPEVMFGMKFSLEVDMWSLGCLLAECYLGEPLFVGKSKKEVLSKTTALLGPFPKEFSEGEYSKEFAEFVGRPTSRYQRLENLRKRLNDCKDSTFLMLVERLLTYLPDRRFTPFEAACHPFVACSTPFLYLTPSPGFIRYPTILLDMSTYPYLPESPDDEEENSESAVSRKRLASFTRCKKPVSSQPQSTQGQKEKETVSNATSGGKKEGVEQQKNSPGNKESANMVGPEGKTATRSDVKETLKSMGLRCEDFTISVYSREQAHAILRRQGVEVTPNNLPSREKIAAMAGRGNYRNAMPPTMHRPPGMRGRPPKNYWPTNPRMPINTRPYNPRGHNIHKPVPRFQQQQQRYRHQQQQQQQQRPQQQDDDDDDCVILDPPDMPKPPPSTLPQQFQLMGTTVQVNRGAKRSHRPAMHQPPAKRSNVRPMQYYHRDQEEYGSETSVQDTLKRLKNYNISITCRKNAGGYGPRGPMDSGSEMSEDGAHMESDDEEDMTKYLECQIGEVDEMPEQEIYDDEEIDCDDKADMDYNPRGKKKKKYKSPRKGRRPFDPSAMLEQEMMSESDIPILDSSGGDIEDPTMLQPEFEQADGDEEFTDGAHERSSEAENDKVEGQEKTDGIDDGETILTDQVGNNEEPNEEEVVGSDPLSETGEEEQNNQMEGEHQEQHDEALHQEMMEQIEKMEEENGHMEENMGDYEEDYQDYQEEDGVHEGTEEASNVNNEDEVPHDPVDAAEGEIQKSSTSNVEGDNNPTSKGQEIPPEDEEIDDELEKELLAGDLGNEGVEGEL